MPVNEKYKQEKRCCILCSERKSDPNAREPTAAGSVSTKNTDSKNRMQ